MKVLILGGTGAIGIYLIEEFIRSNHDIFVTSRKNMADSERVRYLYGNAKDEDFLRSILLNKYDVIIDLMNYSTEEFSKHHELLLDNCKHYIFVSTYRVFSDRGLANIDETSDKLLDVCNDKKYLNTDEYALSKARQEKILYEKKYNNWSIVRPSITYSTNRFQLGTLEADVILPRARQSIPIIIPKSILGNYTTMTWAGDVAKMISNICLLDSAYRNDYNVLTSERVKWIDVCNVYQSSINLKVIPVDHDEFMKLKGSEWQLKYDRSFNRCCDNRKILEAINMNQSELKSVNDGIRFELKKNSQHEFGHSTSTIVNGRIDRILGLKRLPLDNGSKGFIKYIIGRFLIFDIGYQWFTKLKKRRFKI